MSQGAVRVRCSVWLVSRRNVPERKTRTHGDYVGLSEDCQI